MSDEEIDQKGADIGTFFMALVFIAIIITASVLFVLYMLRLI